MSGGSWMTTIDVSLALPGDPLIFSFAEEEPVASLYTGKPLRRLEFSLGARGTAAHEQLNAALTAAVNESVPVADRAGGKWEVTSYYSYPEGNLGMFTHEIKLTEREDLKVERVEFDGLSLTPERWELTPHGDTYMVQLLVSLDPAEHDQFEQAQERHRGAGGTGIYFPVRLAGIQDDPISMRFGQCLWQPLDAGRARHKIVLVPEQGDSQGPGFQQLMEPGMLRVTQRAAITKIRLDRLVQELERAGVLDSEAIARITQEITVIPFAAMREFEMADDVEDFFP